MERLFHIDGEEKELSDKEFVEKIKFNKYYRVVLSNIMREWKYLNQVLLMENIFLYFHTLNHFNLDWEGV